MFNISDKVVCVHAGKVAYSTPSATKVKLGGIYCVAAIWFDYNSAGKSWLLRLVGEPPEYTTDGRELGWDAFRFRLVCEARGRQENRAKAEGEAKR